MENTTNLGLHILSPDEQELNVLEWVYALSASAPSSNMTVLDMVVHDLYANKADVQHTTDSKYFDIDYDGIVSLKPEYRGHPADITYAYAVSDNGIGVDGSKINELPKQIVIPEVINGTAVAGFQPGMFHLNFRVAEVVFPMSAASVPDGFCNDAKYLRSIKNTEHITQVGNKAFRNTRIDKALFPNLKELAAGAFLQAKLMRIADIGDNIIAIPDKAFSGCSALSCVKGGTSVTAVGEETFYGCYALKNLPFLSNITSLATRAFFNARVQFDWSSLAYCSFGAHSTPIQDNTTDYWSGATFTAHETPLNSVFNQRNPEWANEIVGSTGEKWIVGCEWFALLHIHSALSGKTYTSPAEFAAELDALGVLVPTATYRDDTKKIRLAAEALGYAATAYNGTITQSVYQTLCDKLTAGACVYVSMSVKDNVNGGHAVGLYGINDIGEVLVVDSDTGSHLVDIYDDLFTYQMPVQNFTGPCSNFIIIERS